MSWELIAVDNRLSIAVISDLSSMQVLSFDELGWEHVVSEKSAVLVIVAASTGDGDAPDNAAKFFSAMRCCLSALSRSPAALHCASWLYCCYRSLLCPGQS